MTVYKINNVIVPELRVGPEYKNALDTLTRMLEQEANLDIFCAHEAGHLTYFQKMGGDTSNLSYDGPTIHFDQRFDIYPCAVRLIIKDPETYEELEAFAEISVAGGIFEKELEGSVNLGDRDDRNHFHRIYEDARERGVYAKLTEQQMWDWAQERVRSHLLEQQNLDEARRKARDIRSACFVACEEETL